MMLLRGLLHSSKNQSYICGVRRLCKMWVYACMKRHNMYLAALLISGLAVYSGKYFSNMTFGSLLLNTSILFKNNMINVRGWDVTLLPNHQSFVRRVHQLGLTTTMVHGFRYNRLLPKLVYK